MVNLPGFNPFQPNDEDDEEDEPTISFEDAMTLTEEINQTPGWTSEVAASGMDDYEYITVQAVFDRFGLIYQVDLESREEWEYHKARIEQWCAERQSR